MKTLVLKVLVLISTAPFFVGLYLADVEFNQFLIEQQRLQYGQLTFSEAKNSLTSLYLSGVQILQNGFRKKPDITNTDDVFRYVFCSIPASAVVHPTEGFYYWNFKNDNKSISGNIRLADLEKGSLSFAYFESAKVGAKKRNDILGIKTFSEDEGVSIQKISDNTYKLAYAGCESSFLLPNVQPDTEFSLLKGEEYMARLDDESAVRFHFIWNKKTFSFYNVLDEDTGLTEALLPLGEDLLIGERSGFAYYDDTLTGRKVLIGIFNGNSKVNNYFDGPGDQVPYWLSLREYLHIAYPGTASGDGINEHGVFLNRKEWSRLAISPYLRYSKTTQIVDRAKTCRRIEDNSLRITCLTLEWWNTEEWFMQIVEKLKKEGKEVPQATFAKLEVIKNIQAQTQPTVRIAKVLSQETSK